MFAALCVSYGAVDFLRLRGNRLVLFPVQHDDYGNFAHLTGSLSNLWPRPVSRLLIALAGDLGPAGFYPILTILMLAYGALLVVFLFRLFELEISGLESLAIGLFFYTIPSALLWAKYTGLMTNSLSGCFGLLALLALLSAARGDPGGRILASLSVIFYALSIFSKEDFILPPLLLAGYLLVFEKARRRRVVCVLGGFVLCILSLLAYNTLLVRSPFAGPGTSGTYHADLSPASLVSTTLRYLSLGRYSVGLAVAFAVSVAVGLAALPRSRGRLLLAACLPLSLLLPYATLPNHVLPYYPFGWLTWMAAIPITVGMALLPRHAALIVRGFVLGCAAAIGLAAMDMTRAERQGTVDWYQMMADYNRNIVRSLVANAALIRRETTVGVLGIGAPSPWLGSQGEYLVRRLGFHVKWLVFVSKDGPYIGMHRQAILRQNSSVVLLPLEQASSFERLLFLRFDGDGRGTPMRGREALIPSGSRKAGARRILSLWPPQSTAGEIFQRQANGNAAISVVGEGFAPGDCVYWDERRLETTVVNPRVMSASVPSSLLQVSRTVIVSIEAPEDADRPVVKAPFRILARPQSRK